MMTGFKSKFNNPLNCFREPFKLSDGGEIAIDSGLNQNHSKLLIIVPGMLSSTHDHYIQTLISEADKNGFSWKLIN
jgi:predicted alpha/beta-fold hydrolase